MDIVPPAVPDRDNSTLLRAQGKMPGDQSMQKKKRTSVRLIGSAFHRCPLKEEWDFAAGQNAIRIRPANSASFLRIVRKHGIGVDGIRAIVRVPASV